MNSLTSKFVLVVAFLSILSSSEWMTVCADEDTSARKSKAESKNGNETAKAASASAPKLTDAQIDNALEFAKKHHPELASLLKGLRGKSPTEFKRGVREVHLAAIRLDRMQEKQPARFDTELQQWKIDSEIRLLSAKWIITGDKKLERKIQAMLRERQENRLNRLETERDRLAARLEQLDQQINMDAAGLEAVLDTEWDKLVKKAAATRKSRRQMTADNKKESPATRSGEK